MAEFRKLAAILAADVVGFSRLAGADEDRTLARLRALRSDLIDPTIAVHHGRVVKRTGDGALVEFRSVVEAVRCAVEIQNAMVERNAGVPAERRIDFRIGIHLGDVVEESDGDLMGDGVNIAARLEGIAQPGTICLSEDAYRQVRARLDLEVNYLGQTQLKNIAEPVRVYSLQVGLPAQPKAVSPVEPATEEKPVPRLALPDKPSIAVLPFQNMSGDPEQEYFADGMVEDIITALSRARWLFVIARNSSFTYKGKVVDTKQVGRELGVRYVLEGSVRKAGARLRITGQLIDAITGAHLWADQFDGSTEDVFELQDKVALSVAGVIEPALQEAEIRRSTARPTSDLTAYDLYLRALPLMLGWGKGPAPGAGSASRRHRARSQLRPRACRRGVVRQPTRHGRLGRGSRDRPARSTRSRSAGGQGGPRRSRGARMGRRHSRYPRRGHRSLARDARPRAYPQSEQRLRLVLERFFETVRGIDRNGDRALRKVIAARPPYAAAAFL